MEKFNPVNKAQDQKAEAQLLVFDLFCNFFFLLVTTYFVISYFVIIGAEVASLKLRGKHRATYIN